MSENHPRTVWVDIWKYVLSAALSALATAYFIGQRTGQVNALTAWKDEVIIHEKVQDDAIALMNSQGTLSFKFFYEQQYLPKQKDQDEHFKEHDARIRILEIDGKSKQ